MVRFSVSHTCGLAIALSGLISFVSLRAEAAGPPPPPGHLRTLDAHRAVTPPIIDGAIDDEVWAPGPVADGFWASESQRTPTDETRVVVLYDDKALYFAITCLDSRPD